MKNNKNQAPESAADAMWKFEAGLVISAIAVTAITMYVAQYRTDHTEQPVKAKAPSCQFAPKQDHITVTLTCPATSPGDILSFVCEPTSIHLVAQQHLKRGNFTKLSYRPPYQVEIDYGTGSITHEPAMLLDKNRLLWRPTVNQINQLMTRMRDHDEILYNPGPMKKGATRLRTQPSNRVPIDQFRRACPHLQPTFQSQTLYHHP